MRSILQFKPYRIWGRHLFSILCALIFSSILAQAQELTVTGTVVSSENEPLPGVNIRIKGTSEGTITNIQGKYSISVPDGNSTLVFSFIGYIDEEVLIGTQQEINISLEEDITGLEEIVVIGYGSVKKKEVTGAVARVSSDEISKTVTADLGQALQGQVAGVNVTSSGVPGASSDILIRGISTIGNNTPLYVIDGVPFEGTPSISPSEIESIDILKDAASSAIYGTRGAAGVILITTKQGKEGSLKVSVNGSYGVSKITSHIPLMNAQEDTYFNLVQQRNISGITDDQATLNLQKYPVSFQYDTDIRETIFIDNAPTQDYNVNISGGSKNITYSVMAGFFDQKGVLINSHYKRFNTRANTTYKNGRWTIDASVGMTQDNKDEAPGGIITQAIKYKPTQEDFDNDAANAGETITTVGGDDGNRIGWVLQSLNNTDNTTSNSSYGNFNVNVDIIEGLSLSSRLGLNNRYAYQKKFAPYQEVIDIWESTVSNPEDSYVENISSKRNNLSWDAALKYQKSFGEHNITAQAIYTVEQMTYESFRAKGSGIIDNQIRVLDGTSINPSVRSTDQWGGDTDWEHNRIGTLGRILYNYKSRYMLNISGRYDGSAKFGESNRWGFFPSVSAAWNISDEPFWGGLRNIANDAKLRVSRGTTGNESFSPYSYSALINSGYDYAFGPDATDVKLVGLTQTDFANRDVKWETSVQWNAGIDLAFLNNKLTFIAEYYNTEKEDMLFPVQVPGSASGKNNSTTWLNIGNMINKGYELALGYRTKVRRFSWGVNATFSHNENEVTKMNTDSRFLLMSGNDLISGAYSTSRITALATGREVASYYIYTTDGIVDSDEKLAEYQKIVGTARKGDVIYKDNNGDGIITDDDREYVGSGLPKYTAGLSFNCEYRGFDFFMQWYTAIGHEIMNGSKATAYGWGRHKDQVYSWSEANPVTPIPAYRGDTKSHPNFAGHSDLWLEDGSYLRLKTLTIGYTLPHSMLERVKLSKVRFYLSAQNSLTLTKYSGYDPEIGGNISSRGLDKGNYPITAFYLVGLNLNF